MPVPQTIPTAPPLATRVPENRKLTLSWTAAWSLLIGSVILFTGFTSPVNIA